MEKERIPSTKSATTESKHVWQLLTQNFYWSHESLQATKVGVRSTNNSLPKDNVRLQVFEVIVAAVFARIRPDYDWWVTPNMPDGGVDFIGHGAFLTSKELDINAVITIGGQCKKRERVDDVVGELSGSFLRMARTLHPTLFVAAFSASLTSQRVEEARDTLEHTLNRHCHILDRYQLENLIANNLDAVRPIISKAFEPTIALEIFDYFKKLHLEKPTVSVQVLSPTSTLAGEPFNICINITQEVPRNTTFFLRWAPSSSSAEEDESSINLIAPPEMGTQTGLRIIVTQEQDNPFLFKQNVELLSYAIGSQSLGTVEIYFDNEESRQLLYREPLPRIRVIENLRPRFYDAPYLEPMDELRRGLEQAHVGKVSCVAITGAGGAGKTRLCEEMLLEAKRSGAYVVSARQAHSTEFPRRILANLLVALIGEDAISEKSKSAVNSLLQGLEPKLAKRARPAIEALIGETGRSASFDDDQSLISVFLLLISQCSRKSVAVIHLHDLHWCTIDVLDLIDRLIWQLGNLNNLKKSAGSPTGMRTLFLLEGRHHEHRDDKMTGWSTRMFERFTERLACPKAHCRAFDLNESAIFTRWLFEQEHSARRKLPHALLDLQNDLIVSVHRAAGGNPLHILEQIKLLQQHGIISQNPQTGFVFMAKPELKHIPLPSNVFATIEARWRYYWVHQKKVAILLWAAALVDDNLPASLFHHLWRELAPEITENDLNATEFLQMPEDSYEGMQVSFRHENYFYTVRNLELQRSIRQEVVDAYTSWFKNASHLSPDLRFAQAKIELNALKPDLSKTREYLEIARDDALKRHDNSLLSRVLVTLLDGVIWPLHQQRVLSKNQLLQAFVDEYELCSLLAQSGRTDVAYERVQKILKLLEGCLQSYPITIDMSIDPLVKQKFLFLSMKAKLLFHNRRPGESVAITESAVKELSLLMRGLDENEQSQEDWRRFIVKIYHTHSAAGALAGDLNQATVEARRAARLAKSLVYIDQDALDVIITSCNILLAEAPTESEAELEYYKNLSGNISMQEGTKLRLDINLSMAHIVLAYRHDEESERKKEQRLLAAKEMLHGVFRRAHPLGRIKDASASSLLLGLICALEGNPEDIDWFSQSAALAIRSRQLETLWRANINLAHSLFRAGQSAHDPAAAALDLMLHSLSSFAEPDQSPRFSLLSVPMAHAVRYLILYGDEKSHVTLKKVPELRSLFENLENGELKKDRDGRNSHEWFRVGNFDYVLY